MSTPTDAKMTSRDPTTGRLRRRRGAPPAADPAPHNCLAGFRCPRCGGSREFCVRGHWWEDDGCETSNAHPAEDPAASCVCGDCDHAGRVRDFHAPGRTP
jgi:hypothetical protein